MTREDVENIALTKRGVDDLVIEMREVKGLLKNQYRESVDRFAAHGRGRKLVVDP